MTDAASTKDPRVPPSGSADEDGTRNVPVPDELRRVCARLSEEVRRLCPYCAGTELVTIAPSEWAGVMSHYDHRAGESSPKTCFAGRIPAVLSALQDGRRPAAADVSAARNQMCPRTICWGCRGDQGCPSRQLRDFLRGWSPDPGGNPEALLRQRIEPLIEGEVVGGLTDRLLHGTGIAIPAGLVDDAPGVSDPPRHGGADERRCRSVARPVEPRRQLAYVKETTPGASEPPMPRLVKFPPGDSVGHLLSFEVAADATVEDVLPQIERVLRDRMPSREPDLDAPVASATDLVRMVENCMAHEEPPNEEVVSAARRVRDELLDVDAALELCAPEGLRIADLLRSSGLARAERVRKAVEWMYEFRAAFAAKQANATGLSRALREVQAALDINAKTQPHEVVAAVHALRQKLTREQGQHSEARRTLEDRRAEIRGALAELKAAPGTGLVDACRGRMRELARLQSAGAELNEIRSVLGMDAEDDAVALGVCQLHDAAEERRLLLGKLRNRLEAMRDADLVARAEAVMEDLKRNHCERDRAEKDRDQLRAELDALDKIASAAGLGQAPLPEFIQKLVNERASNEVPTIETTVESFTPEPVFVLLGGVLVNVDSIDEVADTGDGWVTVRTLAPDGRRGYRQIKGSPAAVHAAIEGAKRDARPPLIIKGGFTQAREEAIRADADAAGLRVVFLPRMAELVNADDVDADVAEVMRPLTLREHLQLAGTMNRCRFPEPFESMISEEPPRTEPPTNAPMPMMDIQEFVDLGLLQEVNRAFLHPRGLALVVEESGEGDARLVGIWDSREEPDGIAYLWGQDEAESAWRKYQSSMRLMLERRSARQALFGGEFIEPLPSASRRVTAAVEQSLEDAIRQESFRRCTNPGDVPGPGRPS